MGWVEVAEPWARPPRPRPPRTASSWSGPLDVDRGWAELADAEIGPDAGLDLGGVEDLAITDAIVAGLALGRTDGAERRIAIKRSELVDCDLSGATVTTVQGSVLRGCKLIGTRCSGAPLSDVLLERCVLRYTELRMARLSRVSFDRCLLDEVDGHRLEAADVAFPGSELTGVDLDQLEAERVDLREAASLDFRVVNRLRGCLVAEGQLLALAPALAMAAGVDVERD